MRHQKILLAIILLVSVQWVNAQSTVEHQLIDKSNGNLLYYYQKEEIQGHPFFKDKWINANITDQNGYVFKNIAIKIDTYRNKVVFNRNDSSYELGPMVAQVCFFPNAGDTTQKMIFKNGYDVTAFIKTDKYLQVLAEGKITLLKDYHKELEEYTEYGNATKMKRYRDVEQYYIGKEGQFTGMGQSKKNLENVLQAKWPQVDAFLKQKEFSGKDEKSWVAAITYFNSL